MKSKRAREHSIVAECRRAKSQKEVHEPIPRDLFVTYILPMLPQRDYESAVMKAVKSKSAADLHFLLGYTKATVPLNRQGTVVLNHCFTPRPKRCSNRIIMQTIKTMLITGHRGPERYAGPSIVWPRPIPSLTRAPEPP